MDGLDIFACPMCQPADLIRESDNYVCSSCHARYAIRNNAPILLRADSAVLAAEADRAQFWNAGWEKRSREWLNLDRDGLITLRQSFADALRREAYPSVVDVTQDRVRGKVFLNIGCGGGLEGLLFAGYGAHYFGVDVSFNAARYTTELVRKAGFQGIAAQGEAEHLPVRNSSVDFLYSNGVLHHTPKTEATLTEVHRVLKSGGTAMIGLYPTYSVHFLTYRLKGLLAGKWGRRSYADWLHGITELEWKTDGRENRWTKTYTRSEFAAMLRRAGFRDITIGQIHFQLKELPILGKLIHRYLPAGIAERRGGRFGGMLMATCRKT